jgi:hypothetical protein
MNVSHALKNGLWLLALFLFTLETIEIKEAAGSW